MFHSSNSPTRYDADWQHWGDMKKYGPYARHIRRIILQMVSPLHFQSVLDAGCGQGDLLRSLCFAFPQVEPTGCDVSRVAIDAAHIQVPSGEFFELDLSQGHLPREFDLVICNDVLEHIPDDVSALCHLAQMTQHYLLLGTVQGRMRSIEPSAWGHVRNYARGELQTKVNQAGLTIQSVVEWGFPFYSPLYRDLTCLLGENSTEGHYGVTRKFIAQIIYQLFRLNSSAHGDVLFVLAARKSVLTS